MYEQFFGLTEAPFTLTPNTHFFYIDVIFLHKYPITSQNQTRCEIQ